MRRKKRGRQRDDTYSSQGKELGFKLLVAFARYSTKGD